VPVTASVACLAHVPGAAVQELSSSVTVASGTSTANQVDCPRNVGGGFSISSPHLDLQYFFWDLGPLNWTMVVKNSGPTAATATLFVECLIAPSVGLTPFGTSTITTLLQGGEQTITALCPQGSYFASGGGIIVSSLPHVSPQNVRILGLAPASNARGWSADLSVVGGATTVEVAVVCLSFS
jgi:hypothetical protein